MRFRFSAAVLALSVLLPLDRVCADPAGDAAPILAHAKAALGPQWSALGGVVVHGTVTIAGVSMPYTYAADLQHGFDRMTIAMKTPYSYGVDAQGEWSATGSRVMIERNTEEAAQSDCYMTRAAFTQAGAGGASVVAAEDHGTTKVVKLTPAGGKTIDLTFDADSGHLLSQKFDGGGIAFSDYRLVAGVPFAFRQEDGGEKQPIVFTASDVTFLSHAPSDQIVRPATSTSAVPQPPSDTIADTAAVLHAVATAEGDDVWHAYGARTDRGTIAIGAKVYSYVSVVDLHTGFTRRIWQRGSDTVELGVDASGSWVTLNGKLTRWDDPLSRKGAITSAYVERRGYTEPDAGGAKVTGRRILSEGRLLLMLDIVPPGGIPVALWVDPATSMIVRQDTIANGGLNTTKYYDYRTVAKISLAYHSEGHGMVIDLTNVDFRPAAPAAAAITGPEK